MKTAMPVQKLRSIEDMNHASAADGRLPGFERSESPSRGNPMM